MLPKRVLGLIAVLFSICLVPSSTILTAQAQGSAIAAALERSAIADFGWTRKIIKNGVALVYHQSQVYSWQNFPANHPNAQQNPGLVRQSVAGNLGISRGTFTASIILTTHGSEGKCRPDDFRTFMPVEEGCGGKSPQAGSRI